MIERVVYILGAGFSRALGLPLISDFREKSDDVFFSDQKKYAHFREVTEAIQKLSGVKSIFKSDLFNIEEILSLLAMGDFLKNQPLQGKFIDYIKDVIAFYTPDIPKTVLSGNWHETLFANQQRNTPDDLRYQSYGYFVAGLLNLKLTKTGPQFTGQDVTVSVNKNPKAAYGVITLNYDLVLEKLERYCKTEYKSDGSEFGFCQDDKNIPGFMFSQDDPTPLAKLHGSVDGKTIIPPTWSKGANPEIIPAWNMAHRMLQGATQLRIIGFSLPIGDAYIKFLLKSAMINNPYLKWIDVICLDDDNSVRERYNDFIEFPKYRFASTKAEEYLLKIRMSDDSSNDLIIPGPTNNSIMAGSPVAITFNRLEAAHHDFMRFNQDNRTS